MRAAGTSRWIDEDAERKETPLRHLVGTEEEENCEERGEERSQGGAGRGAKRRGKDVSSCTMHSRSSLRSSHQFSPDQGMGGSELLTPFRPTA